MVTYGTIYTLLALAVQLIPHETVGYVYPTWSVILGYLGLLIITLAGLVRTWSAHPAITLTPSA